MMTVTYHQIKMIFSNIDFNMNVNNLVHNLYENHLYFNMNIEELKWFISVSFTYIFDLTTVPEPI